jgi:hypothetical protein
MMEYLTTIPWLVALYHAGNIDLLDKEDRSPLVRSIVRVYDNRWVQCWLSYGELATALPQAWIDERLRINAK